MTIRLPCPECRRGLKVPDAALGKKVQCPACGNRFLGTLPASPPPVEQEQPAPAPAAPFPRLELDEPASPNLQLDEPPKPPAVEPVEAEVLEPEVLEPEVLEPAVVEEEPLTPTLVRKAKKAPNEDAEGPVEAEVLEEEDVGPARRTKGRAAQKKSRKGLLIGCLAGVAVVLLACGGVGFGVYRLVNADIADADWKPYSPPGAACTLLMPGDPAVTTETEFGVTTTKYTVQRVWSRAEFMLAVADLPAHLVEPNTLDTLTEEETRALMNGAGGGKILARYPIALGAHAGREFQIELSKGQKVIGRFYVVKVGAFSRVYELLAAGPKMEAGKGAAAKFFNSFQIQAPTRP